VYSVAGEVYDRALLPEIQGRMRGHRPPLQFAPCSDLEPVTELMILVHLTGDQGTEIGKRK
jgi:hypothetical protein